MPENTDFPLKNRLESLIKMVKELTSGNEKFENLQNHLEVLSRNLGDQQELEKESLKMKLVVFESLIKSAHGRWKKAEDKKSATEDEKKVIQAERNEALAIIKNFTEALKQSAHAFCYFEKFFEQPGYLIVWLRDGKGNRLDASAVGNELIEKIKSAKVGQLVLIVPASGETPANMVAEVYDEPEAEGSLVTIKEILDSRRLKVGDEHGERIVALTPYVSQDFAVGDKVLVGPSGFVTEKFNKAEVQDLVLQETSISYNDIGGLDREIGQFRGKIEFHSLHSEAAALFGLPRTKGVLIIGPPGNGKTMLAQASVKETAKFLSEKTGKEIKGYYILINGPADVLSKWVGDSPGKVKKIFQEARRKSDEGHLVFIIFDEFESMFVIRQQEENDAGVRKELVNQLCAEMDGIIGLSNVIVVGLTNRPDIIDPAVLRRFSFKLYIPRPSREGAESILSKAIPPQAPIHGKYFDDKNYEGDWYYPTDKAGKRRPEGNGFSRFPLKKDRETVIKHFVTKLFGSCYDSGKKENKLLRVIDIHGNSKDFTIGDLMSGDLIVKIANRAKEIAVNRWVSVSEEEKASEGLKLHDFYKAMEEVVSVEIKIPVMKNEALREWLSVNGWQVQDIKRTVPLLNLEEDSSSSDEESRMV